MCVCACVLTFARAAACCFSAAVAKLRVTPQDTRAYNAFAQASSQRLQHFNAQDISNLSP